MTITFNGSTRRIQLPIGMVELDLPLLYSRYKDWVLSGNSQWLPAFSTVGGEIASIPLYLFLLNGWRIIPQPAHHTLNVVGGTLEVDGGGEPFLDPVGSWSIRITRQVPGIAIGYSTTGGGGGSSGPSAEVIAQAVRAVLAADFDRLESSVENIDCGSGGSTITGLTPRPSVVVPSSQNVVPVEGGVVVVDGTIVAINSDDTDEVPVYQGPAIQDDRVVIITG